MQRIEIIEDTSDMSLSSINDSLRHGWTVKSVTPIVQTYTAKLCIVLEKPDNNSTKKVDPEFDESDVNTLKDADNSLDDIDLDDGLSLLLDNDDIDSPF